MAGISGLGCDPTSVGGVGCVVIKAHPCFFKADCLVTLEVCLLQDADLGVMLLEETEHQGALNHRAKAPNIPQNYCELRHLGYGKGN